MSTFEVQLVVDQDVTVLRLTGDLDIASAPDLILGANAAVLRGLPVLRIDMADLAFIDPSGVSALIRTRNLCAKHDIELLVTGAGPRVQRLFEIVGLQGWPGDSPGRV